MRAYIVVTAAKVDRPEELEALEVVDSEAEEMETLEGKYRS